MTDKTASPKPLHIPKLNSRDEAHTERLFCLEVSEHYIASGSADRSVRLWSKDSKRLALPPLLGHESAVTAVELCEDLGIVTSGDSTGVLILWGLRDGQMIRRIQAHEDVIQALTISHMALVSTSRDLCAKTWRVAVGHRRSKGVGGESKPLENVPEEVELELRHTLSGHAMNVAAAQISLDGRYMYTASGDRSLRIWDLESGTCVKKLDGVASMLQFQLIQGGRGTTVLGACTDSTVRLYKINMEDGTCTVKSCLEGHMNVVRSVKIFGDFRGRRGAGKDWKIVSVSYDGTVKIWGRTEEKEESLGWECVKTLSFSDEVLTPFTVLNHQEVTDEGFVNVKHVPSKVLDVQVDGTWVYCCGEGAEILAWEL